VQHQNRAKPGLHEVGSIVVPGDCQMHCVGSLWACDVFQVIEFVMIVMVE
jgi:hypothetical protein